MLLTDKVYFLRRNVICDGTYMSYDPPLPKIAKRFSDVHATEMETWWIVSGTREEWL